MEIDVSFYKNVFLLMQVVPAPHECIKHFKKGMFNKPNTSGFIYISHYLLSIYNVKQFKRMVAWPLMNKTDEKKYRSEIKQYLNIIANENSDINFPPILMSHLLQAGGTRFLIIMWKISQVSLRAYIRRKYQMMIFQAPRIGDNTDIAQTYFTTTNLKRNIAISKFYEETKLTTEKFKHYVKCKYNDLIIMQTTIFEIKENLMKYVPILPVNSMIAIRLINTEDTEIINLWKTNINEKIEFLHNVNFNLNKLKALSNSLCTLSSFKNCKFLNGNDLPKVRNEIAAEYIAHSKEYLGYGLYKNENLIFHVLLSLLNQTLKQLYYHLNVTNLLDLSGYESRIIQHCTAMKCWEIELHKLLTEVSDTFYNVQFTLQERSLNGTFEIDISFPRNLEMVLFSPKFNFSVSENAGYEKLFKKLCFSPLEGRHKHLFRKHKRNLFNLSKELTVDDSIESFAIHWKYPQILSLNTVNNYSNNIDVSPRYSRLFSTIDSKRKYFKENNATSTPKASRKKIKSRKSIS